MSEQTKSKFSSKTALAKLTNPYGSLEETELCRLNVDVSVADACLLRGLLPVRGMIQLVVTNLIKTYCDELRLNDATTFIDCERAIDILLQQRHSGAANPIAPNGLFGVPDHATSGDSASRHDTGAASHPHLEAPRVEEVIPDLPSNLKKGRVGNRRSVATKGSSKTSKAKADA